MGKFRQNKIHFYEQGIVPQGSIPALSGIGGYVFDALVIADFAPVLNVGASVTNAAIQDAFVVPQRCVIAKVAVALNPGAGVVAGDAFNIVKNTVAETGSAGTGQTIQATGNSVFATDKAIGGLTFVSAGPANPGGVGGNVFAPDQPEAYYETGDLLTLRLVTSAAAGVHFASIRVTMLLAFLDPIPWKPVPGATGATPTGSGADPNTDW